MLAADWVTISALATAGGTLVLALATFASVRSANRAARVAERSLLVGLRPLLLPSRLDDPPQKVGYSDEKWFVAQAGGVPLPLPPQLEPSARAELLKHVHGVLLTGGGDVDPARFGEPPHPATAEVSPARDSLEIDLTRWALENRVPLLAICRGIQVLNVALGGSLHQDIPSEPGSPLDHSQAGLQGNARSVTAH